jgi:hypothetical protein
MRPDEAWRRREAVAVGGPVLVECLTGEPVLLPPMVVPLAGREVDLDRRVDVPGPKSEDEGGRRVAGVRREDLEAERTMKGFELSAREGLASRRVACVFVAFVGEEEIDDATVFDAGRTDGVRGVFASERPRRWVGVFGLNDITVVDFNAEHQRAGEKRGREDAMRQTRDSDGRRRADPESDLNLRAHVPSARCITWARRPFLLQSLLRPSGHAFNIIP